MTTYNYKLWKWGHDQWGHEIGILTKEAEKELEQAKKDNPDVDFVRLAQRVRSKELKPR